MKPVADGGAGEKPTMINSKKCPNKKSEFGCYLSTTCGYVKTSGIAWPIYTAMHHLRYTYGHFTVSHISTAPSWGAGSDVPDQSASLPNGHLGGHQKTID